MPVPRSARRSSGATLPSITTASSDAFSHTNQKDYVDWISAAKSDDTRQKRLDQAIEWMAEGKPRNWKYMKK